MVSCSGEAAVLLRRGGESSGIRVIIPGSTRPRQRRTVNGHMARRWQTMSEERLLGLRLCELDLRIEGSAMEERTVRLDEELAAKGLRFRPHYFSYTEPSFEIDFTSPMVKKMGKDWLEIAGCGMVHPKVFENVGYDPEVWSGWAFGFGIERIAMIRYNITDIRLFYENDARFLGQF